MSFLKIKIKNYLFGSVVCSATLCLLLGAFLFSQGLSFKPPFASDSHIISLVEGDIGIQNESSDIQTNLGNVITFAHESLVSSDNNLFSMPVGSSFYNVTSITGITAVIVSFGQNAGILDLYYGVDESCSYTASQLTESNYSYDFSGVYPSHFSIVAISDADIKSITIQYDCMSGRQEDFIYAINDDETGYQVSSYVGLGGNVTIPSTYNGLPVKEVLDNAFYSNTTITSLTIPDSIEAIGERAFYNADVITISFGSDSCLASIGYRAFMHCEKLSSFSLPLSVAVLGNECFYGCTSLISYEVSENASLTTIGSSAFRTSKIAKFWLPLGVTTIGSRAFEVPGCQLYTPISAINQPAGWSSGMTGGYATVHYDSVYQSYIAC